MRYRALLLRELFSRNRLIALCLIYVLPIIPFWLIISDITKSNIELASQFVTLHGQQMVIGLPYYFFYSSCVTFVTYYLYVMLPILPALISATLGSTLKSKLHLQYHAWGISLERYTLVVGGSILLLTTGILLLVETAFYLATMSMMGIYIRPEGSLPLYQFVLIPFGDSLAIATFVISIALTAGVLSKEPVGPYIAGIFSSVGILFLGLGGAMQGTAVVGASTSYSWLPMNGLIEWSQCLGWLRYMLEHYSLTDPNYVLVYNELFLSRIPGILVAVLVDWVEALAVFLAAIFATAVIRRVSDL